MLLTIDIGNTNVKLGVFKDNTLLCQVRLGTDSKRTYDEYGAIVGNALKDSLGETINITGCIISSVVPPLTSLFVELATIKYKINPLIVGPGIKTGLDLRVQEPKALGADRIVNCIATKILYGYPAIVIDLGTATTFDVINKDGAYEGGAISPGIQISIDALVSRAAKLQNIELAMPESVIGKSTVTQMQSGTLVGYTCLIDGLVERMIQENGNVDHVIATGGLSSTIATISKTITEVNQDLTLIGLLHLFEMNK